MKTKILIVGLVLLLSGVVYAQKTDSNKPQPKQGVACGIQGLTTEQENAIKGIKKEMHELNKNLKADRDIKEAELNKLMIQDKPDLKAIDSKIDEISAIKVQIEKNKVHSDLKIRELLNEEQRIQFDRKMQENKKAGCTEKEGNMMENKSCNHNQGQGGEAPMDHKQCPHSQDKK